MLLLANPKSVEIQAKLFRGFSDPSCLSILDALSSGALKVTEIVETTGLTQSNVSNLKEQVKLLLKLKYRSKHDTTKTKF